MTIDKQRIFVCEKLLGWKHCRLHSMHGTMPTEGISYNSHPLPPLTLDWVHECIQLLGPGRIISSNPADYPRWKYIGNLCRVLGIRLFDNGSFVGSPDDLFTFANATAEQCLAALVETIKGET